MRQKKDTPFRLPAFFIFCIMFFLFSRDLSAQTALEVPHFALPTVTDGKVIDVRQYKGKVVLINFWATWCPSCRKEIYPLVRLQKEFGEKGLAVLGISVDQGGGRLVKKFIKKSKINYPVMLADQSVIKKFGGVRGIPYSFLVDMAGKVVKSYPGYVPYQILRNDITMLLDFKAPAGEF